MESQRIKNQRVVECTESHVCKVAKKEAKAADLAAAKVAKAVDKARRATKKLQFTQTRSLESTQKAHGQQTNRDIGAAGAPQDCNNFAFTASYFSSFL